MKKIGIVMGSDSDLPVVEKAMATLEKFGVPFEAHVYSAHRTPVEASGTIQAITIWMPLLLSDTVLILKRLRCSAFGQIEY